MRKLAIFTLTLALAIMLGSGTAIAKPGRHHHAVGASVHQAMYMQLLADRYLPESSGNWKKVFEERNRLMEQVKGLDEIKREAFHTEMKRLIHENESTMKAHMETMQQFTRAVESGDEKLIRDVLPKMLAAEQHFNKLLSEALKQSGKKK